MKSFELERGFDQDPRVKFCRNGSTITPAEDIRKEAFAHIHGHEVGGTNPGLLGGSLRRDLNLVLGTP